MPRVSIIVPCFNAERYVGQTIASIRAQAFGDWECVVVDDGSTDGSAAAVEALARQDPRMRLVRQTNGGCAAARNRGFRECSPESRYLLFFDADDLLEPEMLGAMVDYLDRHPEVGLAYCDFRLIDGEDRVIPLEPLAAGWNPRYVPDHLWVRTLPRDWPDTPLVSILGITAIIPSVCVFRREIFRQTPMWDEAMGVIYEDVGLYLHMALRSRVHFVPRKLVGYRRHSTQSSTNVEKFDRHYRKLCDKWRNNPELTPEQREVVRAAWRFHDGPLTLHCGLRAGHQRLRQGRWGEAARFYAGAVRRYAATRLPWWRPA